MTTPLTIDFDLSEHNLIAIGVEGEHRLIPSDTHIDRNIIAIIVPSWAQEIADERCGCTDQGWRFTVVPDAGDGQPSIRGEKCADCVDGHPYRPLQVKCGRTVGEAAVIACVPVKYPTLWFDICQHDGGQWLYQPDGAEGDATIVHFPSAQNYDLALIARIKETQS